MRVVAQRQVAADGFDGRRVEKKKGAEIFIERLQSNPRSGV